MESAESEFILRRIFHVIVMMIYIAIRESIFFPEFLRVLADQRKESIIPFIIQGSVCALFSSRQFFTEIENPLKDSGGRIISMLDFCTLYLYRRMDSTNRARKYDVEVDDGNSFGRSIACSPPVFFTTSRSGTVINFLHLRFEYLLDILFLFHISRVPVMDSSIEIHELSSIS